jgi:hypothetical protein
MEMNSIYHAIMFNVSIHNNNLDIMESQPKDNDDMMQCVTCNKLSLFAPTLKIRQIYPCGTKKNPIVLEMKELNSFLYET